MNVALSIANVLEAVSDLAAAEAKFVLQQVGDVVDSTMEANHPRETGEHSVLLNAILESQDQTQFQRLLLTAFYLEDQGQGSWTGPELNHYLQLIGRESTAVSARIIELTKKGLVESIGKRNARPKLLRLTPTGIEEARPAFYPLADVDDDAVRSTANS